MLIDIVAKINHQPLEVRRAWLLVDYMGLTQVGAANIEGVSASTIQNRLQVARNALQNM